MGGGRGLKANLINPTRELFFQRGDEIFMVFTEDSWERSARRLEKGCCYCRCFWIALWIIE